MCIYVQNRCQLCPKGGLNLAKRWLFTSVIQDTKVNVRLKLLTTGTNVTTVLVCTRKEIKSGLKLVRMETDVATHTCKLLSRKNLNTGLPILFFYKFLRNKGLSQKVGLFHLLIGLA